MFPFNKAMKCNSYMHLINVLAKLKLWKINSPENQSNHQTHRHWVVRKFQTPHRYHQHSGHQLICFGHLPAMESCAALLQGIHWRSLHQGHLITGHRKNNKEPHQRVSLDWGNRFVCRTFCYAIKFEPILPWNKNLDNFTLAENKDAGSNVIFWQNSVYQKLSTW